jgi:protein-tyrosine phosphatase
MLKLVSDAGLQDAIEIDSAGTGGWHVGERADPRSRQTAEGRGVPLPSRARQFISKDFSRFDYIVAMDKSNRENLERIAPNPKDAARITLLRSFDSQSPNNADVPDPYYGGPRGFDDVFDICERGCKGLLATIVRDHNLG